MKIRVQCSLEQRMWPAGKFWGGEPPPEPPPPDDPGLTAAHWLQPTNWLLESQYGSPGADLASQTNSNERATNTLQNNQASPTTAQQASGGLGAQGTTVPARVSDPSPIPHDQPGTLANAKITTDTQGLLGREDVITDETDESSASGCAQRLQSQSPLSAVAPLSSFEAATACGAVQPEGAETPLSALGPKFRVQRHQSPEAPFMSPAWMHMFLRTAPQSFQDLLLAACHYCDHSPRKKLTEIDATFTFNAYGYIIFDQNNWAT